MTPDLILISFSLLTWGLGETMFFYFNPLYLQKLGADPLIIGIVLGVVGFAMAVAHTPAGYLSDRVGRRPLLIFAWTLGVLAGWIMALAPNLGVFITGMVLYGLTAFVVSPMNSYITAARGKLSPGRAMTLVSAMYNIGAIAGPLIGGYIGDNYGLEKTYLAAAIIFIVSWAILVFIRPQPRDHHDPDSPPASLFDNRRFIGYLGLVFAVIFACYLPQPLTANFLQNQRGITLEQVGQLGSTNSLGIVLFNLILGQFNPRIGFFIGQAAMAGFSLLLWRGTGIEHFYMAYFMMSGFRGIRPLISAQVRELVHISQMGLAYGISETVSAVPNIIAPPLAGLLYTLNPEIIYPISLVLILASLGLSYFFTPRNRPALANTPT